MSALQEFMCAMSLFLALVLQYFVFFIRLCEGPKLTKREFLNHIVPVWGLFFKVLEYYKKLEDK